MRGSRRPHKVRMEVAVLCGILIAAVALLVLYQSVVSSQSSIEGEEPLSIMIDFSGRTPDSWPRSVTVWQYLNGSLNLKEQEAYDMTRYVIDGLPPVRSPFDLLLEAADLLGIAISFERYINGVFVTSIDGVRNGPGNAGWTYYVNDDPETGDLIPLAADLFVLSPGDAVLWYFSE